MSETLRTDYTPESLRKEAEELKLLILEAEEAEGVVAKLLQYVEIGEIAPETHAERCEILKAAIRGKLKACNNYPELYEQARRLNNIVSLFSEILKEEKVKM